MIDLSICVLHYNRWDLTRECIASIDQQHIPCDYEKVLVDNGSTEDRHHGIAGDWRLVRYEENRGHIVGQNRCFESAQGIWVLFVANDVRLRPKAIRELWYSSHLGHIRQPLLITPGGQVDNAGLFWKWPGYGVSRTPYHPQLPDCITSTCYLMEKEVWNKVGKFDERLRTSHEDVDFSLRLHELGYNVYARPDARAIHLGNSTLRDQLSHNRAAFHRDRLYVIRKHYRGLDYLTRYLAVQLIDHLPRLPM